MPRDLFKIAEQLAKTLWTKIIGHAFFREQPQSVFDILPFTAEIAQHDPKTIAAMTADTNLAVIAPRLQNAQTAVGRRLRARPAVCRHTQAEPLPGAGAAVLHARVANIAARDAVRLGQTLRGAGGAQTHLLHFHTEMLAVAAKIETQFFFDLEVVHKRFQARSA